MKIWQFLICEGGVRDEQGRRLKDVFRLIPDADCVIPMLKASEDDSLWVAGFRSNLAGLLHWPSDHPLPTLWVQLDEFAEIIIAEANRLAAAADVLQRQASSPD